MVTTESVTIRAVSFQMGFKIMGTIGILMAAYEENELTVVPLETINKSSLNVAKSPCRRAFLFGSKNVP